MQETKRSASKAPLKVQDVGLDEIRTAMSRLQEEINRLQSGLKDHEKVKGNLELAWKAIQQLQQYRDEDNESLAIVVDDIAQRHEELMEKLASVQKELENSIRHGSIRSERHDYQQSEEKLYSFAGVEASKETWMKVLKFVVGLTVLAAGAYVVYRHTSSSRKTSGTTPSVVM